MKITDSRLRSAPNHSSSSQSLRLEDQVKALAERVRSSRASLESEFSAKRKREDFSSAFADAFPKRQKAKTSSSIRMDELVEECFRESLFLTKEKNENEASSFLISDDQKTLGKEFKFFFDDSKDKMISKNGDSYEGELRGGRLHGYGRLIYHTGVSYEGGFENGLFHGPGRFTFPNGDVYEAKFVRGVRSDNGTLTFADGRVYKGLFAGLYHDELVDIS